MGVSAGSIVFAANLPDNIEVFSALLNVHCSADCSVAEGELDMHGKSCVNLGNEQAIVYDDNGKMFVIS